MNLGKPIQPTKEVLPLEDISEFEVETEFESLLHRVNFHHLYYFWVVASTRSIRKASVKLMLAPATVSRQLKELESRFCTKLITRSSQSHQLTEVGELVFLYCEELFGLARQMLDSVSGKPTALPNRLTVGVVGVIPKSLLFRLLEPTFYLKDPARIVCIEGTRAKLFADLASNELDLLLIDTPFLPCSSFPVFSRLISDSPVVACATREMAEKYSKGFPLSLNGAPVLLPSKTTFMRQSLDKYFYEQGIKPEIRGEFEDSSIIKLFGEAGIGLFFVPAETAHDMEERFDCRPVGLLESVTARFYAVSKQSRMLNRAVRAVLDAAKLETKNT